MTVQTLACPVSGAEDVQLFVEIPQIPVLCNVLYPTRDEAISVARGDLRLGFSPTSGHIYNYAFDPDLMVYDQAYENSLHFSPRFQKYADGLVDRLIETYELRNKKIVEIGCGKGDFLNMICERGDNTGVGFDPSYEPDLISESDARRFRVVQDLYSEKYADYETDLVCCRHVLEHITEPQPFMASIRRTLGDRHNTVVFFEMPNVRATLRDLAIWDLIYEHCSYFSAPSLSYLFRQAGFDVKVVEETFGKQYLCIDAFPVDDFGQEEQGSDPLLDKVSEEVDSFTIRYEKKLEEWKRHFEQFKRQGKSAVVWGAGSKGVTILNVLNGIHEVEYIVDINPRKQGKYVPGTGQEVVDPSSLTSISPDVIIVMNALYEGEIRKSVEEMGLDVVFLIA